MQGFRHFVSSKMSSASKILRRWYSSSYVLNNRGIFQTNWFLAKSCRMTANAVVGWLVKTTWVMMAIPCKGLDSIKHGQGDIRRMNRPQVLIKVCSEDTNFPQAACACLTLHLLKSTSDKQLATTKQPIEHRWSVVSNQLPGFRHNHRSQYAQEEFALVRWSRSR